MSTVRTSVISNTTSSSTHSNNLVSSKSSNNYEATFNYIEDDDLSQLNKTKSINILRYSKFSNYNDNNKIHKPHRKLCCYHDLPHWQKDNDFIINGYVRETNNIWHCFDTLMFFNNETLNILTHLLPGAIFPFFLSIFIPYLLVHENFISYIPPWLVHLPNFSNTDYTDQNIFTLYFIGFMICLSCSAVFHMLKVHSHKIASMGSRLDYAGILLLIATSLIGIIHYSFIDSPKLKNTFISITSLVGLISLIITWHPEFRTPKWRPIRTSLFILFAFSGLIPIFYGFFNYGWYESINRSGLNFISLEALSYLTGALLYAFRIPERFSPGTFDMIGNSHQLFHCLVVIGAYWHFRALVHAYIVAKSITLGGQLLSKV
jgi:adiponectin receptor